MTAQKKKLSRQRILVVDDMPDNIEVLRGVLHKEYLLQAAINGVKALQIARSAQKPDIILLDVMMPGMDGYEVCRRLKSDSRTAHIPVIFITGMGKVESETLALSLGAVDYITKPIIPAVVKARVKTQLALYDQSRELEYLVQERTEELQSSRLQIIQDLGRAAEYKDNETGMHVLRMSNYARLIAKAAGMDEHAVNLVFNAAPMHDVGKIGIPDSVMLKPGPLNDEEWVIMKTHPVIGAEIIGDSNGSELLEVAVAVAMTHHEKWNGQGYPNGLSGENIPIEGRVVAVADVFDALTSERPYKKAWSVEDAVALMKREAGEHFDPFLINVFINILPEILEVKSTYDDEAVI